MTRDERQDQFINRFINAGAVGTLEAPTGFGKTVVGMKLTKRFRLKRHDRRVAVVVPRIVLKDQWEQVFEKAGLSAYTEVYVINSAINLPKIKCDFLILDEIHRYGAETFRKIFEVAERRFILGLTATLKRLDNRHSILEENCPILDKISLAEARRNGWVSQYIEFNLGIDLPEEDQTNYDLKNAEFIKYFNVFEFNFNRMMQCSFKPFPKRITDANGNTLRYEEPPAVKLAKQFGWRGNSAYDAYVISARNRKLPKERRSPIWGGNPNHSFHPNKINGWAIRGMTLIREMGEMINSHPDKLETVSQLINGLNLKTITFGNTIESAERLKESLGRRAVVYHSDIKGETRKVRVTKEYKTEKGLLKFLEKNPEAKRWGESNTAYWYVEKNISAGKIKKENLRKIQETATIDTLCTAKSLDEGFDYPGAECGIIYGRSKNPTQQIQRVGRIIRLFTYEDGSEKIGLIINVYFRNTKDEKALKKAQAKSPPAFNANSVNELIDEWRQMQ